MTAPWIALAAGVLLLAAVIGSVIFSRLRARLRRAVIVDLGDATSVDGDTGAVRSVQRADLLLDEAALAEIWSPAHLERLARTYWRFLSRVTLGLIRVHYTATERSVILLVPALRLLTVPARRPAAPACTSRSRWPTSIRRSPRA